MLFPPGLRVWLRCACSGILCVFHICDAAIRWELFVRTRSGPGGSRRALYRVAATATSLVIATLVQMPPALAASGPGVSASVQNKSVSGWSVKPKKVTAPKPLPVKTDPVVWPSAASGDVDLQAQVDGRRVGHGVVGGLPVTVTALDSTSDLQRGSSVADAAAAVNQPSRVRVEVAGHAASGKAGAAVAMRLLRTDGKTGTAKVKVEVGYGAFHDAFGANWAYRLRLVTLPTCSLTTPAADGCGQETAVASSINTQTKTVAGELSISGETTVVALDSTATSATDDFSQTPLSQSASWQAGQSGGGFSWSYDVPMVPVPGGLAPKVSLGYSSASVDGRTAHANNQTSWIGEGWDYDPGYIERSYMSCGVDTTPVTPTWTPATPMMCWRVPNAHIVWEGRSTELIPDDASASPNQATPNVWHLADDDATKVEYITDGTDERTLNWNDERWRLTTKDGTQYYFGLSVVGGTRTNSVWGQPVLSNSTGEPCFASSSISNSWCAMAYRWNLDYVVDPHGNTMVYTYAKEYNHAAVPGTSTSYDQGGYLTEIAYGLRADAQPGTQPAAKVVFEVADRCWTSTCSTHDSTNWPDVPWDLYCGSGSTSCDAPTYWITKRLLNIKVQVLKPNGPGGAAQYNTVSTINLWNPIHGTGHAGYLGVLTLYTITRDGQPPVQFDYGASMQNRALFAAGSGAPESWKYRLQAITTEAGKKIAVTYSGMDSACVGGITPPASDNNNKRCFPQLYDDGSSSVWTWWHKYRVDTVTEQDLVGGAPDVVHAYTYAVSMSLAGKAIGSSSPVLWKHDQAGLTTLDMNYRSWNNWVGYPLVTETVGSGATKSKTLKLYFRGLSGDRTSAGGDNSRVSTITDTDNAATDLWYRAGFLKEEITFDGDTTTILKKIFHDPLSVQSGARALSTSWARVVPLTAYRNNTGWDRTATWIAATNNWRTTQTDHTYDSYNNTLTDNMQGDTSTTADDTCVTNTYNTNPDPDLRRYNGTGSGGISATPVLVNSDWSGYNKMFVIPDFNGDGKKDLIGRNSSTNGMSYLPGNGDGTYGAAVVFWAGSWAGYQDIFSPGDFDGDGKADIIGIAPGGQLYLFKGNNAGGVSTGVQIGTETTWRMFNMFSAGDVNSDGKADLMGRRFFDGKMVVWYGDGTGGISSLSYGFTSGFGTDNVDQLFGWGDYTGDGKADFFASTPTGLYLYAGTGTGTFVPGTLVTSGRIVTDTDWFIPVGDDNADGKPDLLAMGSPFQASAVSTTKTVGVDCSMTPSLPGDAVADTRYYYDQPSISSPSLTQTPYAGDVTRTEKAKSYTGSTANWITTADTVYDKWGRPTDISDGLGRPTHTSYIETLGLTTTKTVTPPTGSTYAVTTDLLPEFGVPLKVTDANGKVTTAQYDSLGRLVKVWWENRSTSVTPNVEYAYSLTGTSAAPYVTTKTLGPDGQQITSHQILDGWLRTRQTQQPTADGGRSITDTQYNSRGLVTKTSSFYNASAPTPALFTGWSDSAVANQHRFSYDGVGRQLTDELWTLDVLQWNVTSTSYDGDRTTVDNPLGGTDTTTIVDALGRTSRLRQYQSFADYTDLIAGDFTGDGKADMQAIRPGAGRVFFAGNGNGTFTPSTSATSTGWDALREWVPGRFDSNTNLDALGIRKSDGAIVRYAGDGAGNLTTATQVGTGFTAVSQLASGDFNGDGYTDLVGIRAGDGMLQYWQASSGGGSFTGPTNLGTGWTGYDHLVGGDANGDGKADLLAIRSDNVLRRALGNGNGTFAAATDLLTGWKRQNLAAADFTGDGKLDLYGAVPIDQADPSLKRRTGDNSTFASAGALGLDEGQAWDTSSYTYDDAGNPTSVTDSAGNQWTYGYDLLGRKTSTVDPDTGTSTTTYDNAGQVIQTKDGRNQILTYTYDLLGRKTGLFKGNSTADVDKLAGWTYDTIARGQIYETARYIGGVNQPGTQAYLQRTTLLDDGYRPKHTDTVIPSAEGALAGTYGADFTYKVNGTANTVTLPAVGGLPAETLTSTYNLVGQLKTLASPAQTYIADTGYAFDGLLAQQILGAATKQVRHTPAYEASTRRMLTDQVDVETTPGTWVNNQATSTYTFDQAGNIQNIATLSAGTQDQVECFDYDGLRRLTTGWTEGSTTTCKSAAPANGGVDAYWKTWTFDLTGNRLTETSYSTTGAVVSSVASAYPATGHGPHSLASVTTTGTGAGTASYDYDAAGNTTSRPGPGVGQQALTWDEEGHLKTVTDGGASTTFTYTADGARLLRRDPGSYVTLTLPDGTELKRNGSGAIAATRYYNGAAVRTANVDTSGNLTGGNKLTWTLTDHHGTGQVVVDASTMVAQRRRSTPYGSARGTQPGGFGNKGFVGGTADATGLTHLGAREYDPATGRFISADPIFDMGDPQQWNGYSYSHANPVSSSDPQGLKDCGDEGCNQYRATGAPATEVRGTPRDETRHTRGPADRLREKLDPDLGYARWAFGFVTRQMILDNASFWFTLRLRYDMNGSADGRQGGPYLLNCTGLVANAWNLDRTYYTSEFMELDGSRDWYRLPALDDLQPGDAVVNEGHIELFARWVSDSDHTKGARFYSFNQPGELVTNPYDNLHPDNGYQSWDTLQDFQPIRYTKIVQDPLIEPR
ncbi:MAG: hypothetical protein HOV77_21565 [Hamadaea sp.]|uniref:FG-GAP-like repeat-containing protein n=1 Tax=Hamadaea sp. TaxID=2024425 RepID=UPI001859F789|nr:FG-GAP-like repeat-containing protein [Hamadaea sp.]NUT21771.1 hypothetical protein [Hamadaea sp.]